MSLNLYKVLYFYMTPNRFYFQPVDHPSEALIIDRQTCSIELNSMFSVGMLPANATSCLVYGIVGIKHLVNCPYLIVITKATQIGLITGEPIYRMDQAQIIPFNHNETIFRDGQHDWNATYVAMLESVLQVPNYYFSYTYDLTNTMQRSSDITNQGTRSHMDYDQKFLWNGHVMRDFDRCPDKASKFRLPFILGFISINNLKLGYGNTSWTLVSRRSTLRAGTRFNSRGIDHDGNVSNFVETEQIVEEGTTVTSFVQIRGSIPLKWRQKINYQYKPPIDIDLSFNHEVPLKKHVEQLRNNYGNISMVCLIDSRGHEGKLAHEFSSRMGYIQKYHNIPYHYFDFHKECSKMRWHRLSILIERIMSEIEAYGYFVKDDGVVLARQSGVIRSNCIDSLDRTNVVQSMIAQCVLEMQLSQFKSFPNGVRLTSYPDFLSVFKNVWADNADAISIQYAGTPALKTDFTRTGQRTQLGLVKDGLNSLTRYVSNNFFDNYRQDSIDLFLGQFEGYPSPLYRPMDLTSYTSPIPLGVAIITLVLLYFYIRLN